jgi:hypothetical protein
MMFVKSSEGIPGSQPPSRQAQEEEAEMEKPPINGALQGPAPLQEDTTGNQTYKCFQLGGIYINPEPVLWIRILIRILHFK